MLKAACLQTEIKDQILNRSLHDCYWYIWRHCAWRKTNTFSFPWNECLDQTDLKTALVFAVTEWECREAAWVWTASFHQVITTLRQVWAKYLETSMTEAAAWQQAALSNVNMRGRTLSSPRTLISNDQSWDFADWFFSCYQRSSIPGLILWMLLIGFYLSSVSFLWWND